MQQAWKVHLALFVVNVIYGLNYNIAKIAMPAYIPAFGFVLIRAFSGTLMFLLIWLLWSREKVAKKDLLLLFMCGISGVAANQLMFFKGLSMTSTINSALIMITSPIMVLVIGGLVSKKTFTPLRLAGMLAGAAGAALIIVVRGNHAGEASLLGDIYILINAIAFAIYLVIVKPLMVRYQPITVILWVFFFGTLCVIPFGASDLATVQWNTLPPQVWYSIAFVIIGTTFLAYGLNIYALSKVDPSIVGIYIYLQPLLAGLIAIYKNGEPFTWLKAAAAVLIFTGVYLVSKKEPRINMD